MGGFFIHLQNGDHLPSLLLRGGYENEFPYEKYEFIIKSKKLGRGGRTIGEAVLFQGPLTWSGVTDEGNGPFQPCWPAFIEGLCT